MSSLEKKLPITIGFIGLGSMGLPIAANLIKGGFKLNVHTRSRKAENHPSLKGAGKCRSPKEISLKSKVLLICVSNDEAVEQVLFGPEGAYTGLKEGYIVIDLSTISPKNSRLFAKKLLKKKVSYLDAPVTGGTEGAQKGSLSILAYTLQSRPLHNDSASTLQRE